MSLARGLRAAGLLSGFFIAVFSACKKDRSPAPPATRADLTKDSIFLYAKQVYLWNDALPSYEGFSPRSYTASSTELGNFEQELFRISQYKINPLTSQPYEFAPAANGANAGYPKYSYISDITAQNPVAVLPAQRKSVDLEDNGYDFGFRPSLYGSPSSYKVYVQAVYPGSDAQSKGLSRGDCLTMINGRSVGSDYNAEVDFLNDAIFNSSDITLKVLKLNGSTVNLALSRKSYRSNPIYKDSVYTSGSRKIGYFAYARFSNMTSSQPQFDRIFNRFVSSGITDLIVDLRYNGGGYVQTAEYLINSIAPASLSGTTMFVEYYNTLMQQGKATILAKQPILDANDHPIYQNGRMLTYADESYTPANRTTRFAKVGSLENLQHVVFIVSRSTASSSELVINSLKPHIADLKIVGSKSYGKPVGFFPIRIDKYDVYFSLFQTKNSQGQGDYFEGLAPDKQADDDLTHQFGDLAESSLKAAYTYITTGSFPSGTQSVSPGSSSSPKLLSEPGTKFGDAEFRGMIENRHRF